MKILKKRKKKTYQSVMTSQVLDIAIEVKSPPINI